MQAAISGPPPKDPLERAIVAAAESNRSYSAEWDFLIRNLARRYVAQLSDYQRDYTITLLAKRALDRGCRDPFVRYLWVRHLEDDDVADAFNAAVTQEGIAIAEEMRQSSYPRYLRANAEGRAWRLFWRNPAERDGAESHRLLTMARETEFWVLSDPMVTERQARGLAETLEGDWESSQTNRDELFAKVDRALTEHFGDCATVHMLRGIRATTRAWEGRGSEYAYKVTDEGWEIFNRELLTAEKELVRAWELDPSDAQIAAEMITVCVGLCRPRAEMEEWFRRGVSTNTRNFILSYKKLFYLAPRWFGSLEEQVSFGRECLAHPEYGEQAALILWYAHCDYQKINRLPLTYFAQPEVWADINQSFAVYFARRPYATAARMKFAYYAWLAKDWKVLGEQLAKTDPAVTNLKDVGGRAGYERMVADSRIHPGEDLAGNGLKGGSAIRNEVAPTDRHRPGPAVDLDRTQRILPLLRLTGVATIGGRQVAILNGRKLSPGDDANLNINGASIEIRLLKVDQHAAIISVPPDPQQYVLRPGSAASPLSY
jgi:hypothetical protein